MANTPKKQDSADDMLAAIEDALWRDGRLPREEVHAAGEVV